MTRNVETLRSTFRVEFATFLREIEERVWSATSRLRDEQHARLLEVMRATIGERYGSADAVIEIERRVTVRCHAPA